MDKISAIVATRDRPEMVEEALASLLAQTTPPDEIIVADDSRGQSARHLADKFPVHLVFTKAGGPAVARNAAVREAQYPWLAFCDDDDFWLPHRLAAQAKAMHPGIDLIYGDTVDAEGERELEFHDTAEGAVFEKLLLDNWIVTSTVLLRRAAFDKAGGFEPDFCPAEDYRLWLKVCRHGRAVKVNKPLAAYREHEGQLQMKIAPMFAATAKTIERTIADFGIAPRDVIGLTRRLRRLYFVQGRIASAESDQAAARAAYRRAWAYERSYFKAPLFWLLSFLNV